MTFKKAERKQIKLKIAVSGPSGSGKTTALLNIATGMGGRIALIDTENGSASLYADKFNFDTLCLEPPFTPDKYVEAINAAEAAGYDLILIDSLSHAWAGEGGTLDKKSAFDARGGNQFANWKAPKADFTRLKNAFLHSKSHVLCSIRSKQDYVIGDDGKPKKVGLAPIIEPSLEYEFSAVLDCAMDHNAIASKDRTHLFDNKIQKITSETGKLLMAWLSSGKPLEDAPAQPTVAQSVPKAVPETVQAPKASPFVAPESIDVLCDSCKAQMILHASKAGYVCPNKRAKDDSHMMFDAKRLEEFRSRAKLMTPTTSDDVA